MANIYTISIYNAVISPDQ